MQNKSSFINYHSMNLNGKLIDLSSPKIMGILNVTPDSFSDGGKFNEEKSALVQTEKMLKDGAEIIDIGAQSTRPNSEFLKAEDEISRIGTVISKIKKEFPEALISLDMVLEKKLLPPLLEQQAQILRIKALIELKEEPKAKNAFNQLSNLSPADHLAISELFNRLTFNHKLRLH